MGELKDIITGRQSSKKYRKDNFSNSGARSGDFIGRNLEPQHNSEMTIRKIVSGETEDTIGNNDTGTTSPRMTVNEMFNIINRKKNSNNTGSDIKSFFSGNVNKANSSAENLKEAIKNPNKSLENRVKGLTYMYNAAVATGDTKTAEKMQKEYDELADRVNKQTEINRQNAETAEAENAKLAEQANKEQKYADKYKNSTLEQRKNARIHATTEELDWLNKHMYDNSSSKELEEYKKELSKEYENLYDRGTTGTDENKEARRRNIEDEQDKIDTYINRAKLSEQKKKEYDDIVDKNVILKTVMQKYYALQHYDDTKHMLASTGHDTDSIKNQVTLDDYNYINKLSDKERTQIEKNFKNLKKEGYDTESLYKWYERERDAAKAAETTRTSTEYADEHHILGSIASVGARLGGAVPDAIKYISTDLDKKYNGGDGYINPEATNTAISDAMRAKVSENINNDFGSFLYNTGMSMADFASLLPLNAVPGGQALSLGIMGTSAGVGSANEVINNGGTIDNAVKTGIASGIAETLFEKFSLEQLSAFRASGKSTFRAAVGNVLKGAFTEGSEEAFTDLANRLTDDAINKDLSSYNLAKKNYIDQGMSESEAENAASWDFWKNVGLDFAGGAISGGVLNLATAGVNLAGAKIDMAQNKESNAQIGKAVMADENFDLDLLIRQGLATDKNERAYNYAAKMQKLIETDNEGKISAGDVGNLMYLINREVGKNPELVNKIAQVKKQNTQEQGNKTVNVQNEQNPTQQNTAQNGQQNAEQAQASTAINATKKADTEDIGKMYGVYAFGKKHPNGIIATDTSTGKVVKVALKSLESSSKINRSDDENTLVFNTNDGKQVNADSITFSDSQLDTIVHSANEFDTYGARNYIANFEEWRESPQAQKMSNDEMLYKYNRAYSAAYSFGREGVKLDSLKETSEYKILKNILGEQIVSQALSTGRRDVDINTQHHANRLTELINRNGRADTSGVTVYADSGTEVSHIPQELISVLGNLATKTGRNIIISDRLADGVNGVARDGNIILSSEISSQKILATALHEAGHMIKKTNPTEWRTLSDFVSDYLVRKGVDLNKMIDRTIERYGNRLQADEHENTRDAALEEIVCDTLMSIASDEKALNIALSTKQNKSKIAAAIKSLIAKVKDWLIDKSQNYGAKAFEKDLEALENLAHRFSEAADTARENITEQAEVQNGEKIDVEKFSLDEEDKDLVATHNISSQNLMNLINDFDGAGLPVPSIAIEKAENLHDNFGDVTLLFNKDTIDPEADSRNKVYNRDAWTSTFPEVEVKIKDEELQKISERVHLNEAYLESNMFNTSNKERIKKNFFNDLNVRKAFLKEQNIEVTPVAYDKEPRFPMFTNIGVKKFLRKNNCSFDKLVNDIDFRNKLLNDYYDSCTIKSLANKNIQRVNKILDNCAKSKETYNSYKAEFEYAIEYAKGNVQKEINNFSYNDGVVNAIKEHKEEFEKYIEQILSEDVFGEKYIVRDDVDPYDDEGNLKSFDETHYIYNIDNVVKAMKIGASSVGDSFTGGVNYTSTFSAQEFGSIDEIHKNKGNIKELSEEEQSENQQKIIEILTPVIDEVSNSGSYNNDFLIASDNIVDAFKQSKTKNGVYNYLKQYYPALKKSTVDKLFKVRDEIANIPTRYFEAKPHRAVGFNEVMAAVIPADADESLKKALKRMNIPLYEYADESQRADAARKAINTEYTDKTGVIHDTLKFSIDDEYDDLFDFDYADDKHIDFDKAIDKNNPELTIEQIYHHSARNVKEGLLAGKGIKPEQKKIYNMVKSVMRSYHINPNAETDSLVTEYVDALNTFIDSVQNDKSSFTDAFESFVLKCRGALQYSTQLDEQHEAWAKEIRDELKGTTLLIPENAIDTIKENYGSVGKYKKALFGKINVKLEHNAKGINGNAVGSYIEDIGSHLENIGGRSLMIEDGFDWDSDSGYRMLDHIMNYVLAPQYVATYDGKFESESTIDAAAIQMAFDTTAEYLKLQGKAAVMQNNVDKKKLRDINKALRQAEKAKTALNQKTIENYKTDIAEQKAKYNEQREKYRQAYNALKDKKSEEAKKYRDKIHELEELNAKQRAVINTRKKVIADEYRVERDKTKYRQKINTTLERLINRHLKPKPSNNVPISVVKPLYRLLSELTGNYSGFSKGVNDITEKTGYNKTDNQKGERVNKVTLSAETEKLISALNSEIANTNGKITLPPAMRNALLGYNVFDNNGNIKQHFTGLLEDVRNIFEKAEENGKTSLKDFSLSELKRISTAFSEVKKLLDTANKIVINGKEYDAYLVSRKGAEELKKVTGTHKKGSNTQASTAKRTLLAYRKYMSDPIRFARMISGYHNDSVIVQMMEMLNQGQSEAEQLSIDWTNKFEEQMSRFSYKAKKDYVREQAMKFDGIDPNTKRALIDKKTGEQVKVGLTADMLVEMLLEYEDEYGRAHMMYSGYQVPNIKYIKRKNQQLMYSKDSGCYILPTESDISRIRDYVMNNEIAKTVYEICREMYNEDMQNAVNKVSNEKYGYEIAKVKNYCPITIDEDTVYGTFADVLINRSINSRAFLHERENFKYNRLKLKGATAKLTSQIKSVSSWCGLTMPIETFNRVFNMPRYDHANDSLVKAVQEENLNSAENIRQKNNTHSGEEEKSKLSIDEHFTDKYDEWDKKGGRFSFRVGTTSEVLQRLGVDDKNIWWDTSKILKIKNKHPEMTDDILKQVPNVLESPIIVMESYTVKGRLVLFGDVYDAKNNPVLVALELNPIGEGGKSLDIIKIASAYGKDSNLQHMIDKSNILYVEPNEKRTHTWLTGNGLQLPLPSSKYGFSDNIKSQNQGDVKYSVEKEAHSTLSIDEVLDFIEREEKQKKKKKSTPTTEYFPSMKEIMKQQWGNESEEYISKLMGDLQGSTKQADPGRIDMLTGKYIRAVLTANISSAIKQLSSYPLAAARVGWKATLAGLKHIRPGKHTPFLNRALPDSYKQSIPYNEIAKYTPILEYRKQGNNSREMAEISRYKGLIDSSGWVGHTLDRLNWIEKNDVLMVEMNYWIAYEHVKGNMGISPDSKEFMPNVAKTLEDIINNMMPNSSVMQQGQILRSKNPVNRIFTICKSQVFCMVNAAMDASGEYNARLKDYKQAVSEFEKEQARTEVKIAKKQLARTYSSIIVSTAMTCGILMPLIAALFGKWDRYRDEDGNITPWSIGSRLLKNFGSELTGMFLFGDTVYNTVLALIDKNEEFYGLSLPGVDTINDFITGIINIARSDTPEKLRKNISSLVGTLGMLTGLPTKNLMNLFQGACNHIENFTKYGGTPTVNDYGQVSMQMYANYCYEALIDGDKKKFAKLYSEWLKEKTSTGKQVDKSYINSKLKTELEDDTEIIAAGNAFFNGDLTAYENTVEKYSDLGFDKTTVVKAINSIVSDLEDEQKNAEGLDKYDNEEESDSKPELYKYSDAFDFLKNGDTESYEKVEKYLMEHKGKTKNQMKKLMQSASRTDPMFEQYIQASKSNDADTTHTLYRQLMNIYGSESHFKSALRKYQDKIKKQKSK